MRQAMEQIVFSIEASIIFLKPKLTQPQQFWNAQKNLRSHFKFHCN